MLYTKPESNLPGMLSSAVSPFVNFQSFGKLKITTINYSTSTECFVIFNCTLN